MTLCKLEVQEIKVEGSGVAYWVHVTCVMSVFAQVSACSG